MFTGLSAHDSAQSVPLHSPPFPGKRQAKVAPIAPNLPRVKSMPMTPTTARLILVGLLALLIAGLCLPPRKLRAGTPGGKSDAASYAAATEQIRAVGYYNAMGFELRDGRYPMRSRFNWRLPTLFVGLAYAKPVMYGLLGLSIVLLLAGTCSLTSRWPVGLMLAGILAQIGATMLPATPLGLHMPEAWVGLWLAIAVLAYARGWYVAGACVLVAALFVRELIAPFAVVAACMALYGRRWREVAVYAVGGVLVLAFCQWHAQQVAAHVLPGDLAQSRSWVQFGGLRYLLGTVRFGGWLILGPWWLAPFAVVLLVASLFSSAPAHLKAATLTYLLFFSAVGQWFNQGWGWLTAPTWVLAFGYGVIGLQAMWQAARQPARETALRTA